MTYVELAPIYKMFLQTLLLLLLTMQIYLLMDFLFATKRIKESVIQIVGIIMNVGFLIILISDYMYITMNRQPTNIIFHVINLPLWIICLFIVIITGISIGSIGYQKRIRNSIITINAIKEGTDDIPMGICYARKTGLPLLINRKMYHLSLDITGHVLQNAKHFWEMVVNGELPEGFQRVKEGEEPVLLFPNGMAWTFTKEYVNLKNEEIVQVFAIDTTDLYKLSLELEEKNFSLREMNLRLQEHSENVTELMREEEILATKVKIHADMGSALMATRYYLNNPKGKSQVKELIKTWNYNISLLYNEATTEMKEDVFAHLNTAAQAVGVAINVEGRIPKNNIKVERLIVAAARECLTNTVRHGDGNLVNIRICEEHRYYHIEYTNNGSVPQDNVKEGGGLLGLRKRVEDIGGEMKIISNPQFMLILNIPKERR